MKTVFVLKENSDTTEGRGPMVVHSVWDDRDEAIKFMDDQPGVMGRKGKWSQDKYGDWRIEEVPLFSTVKQFIDENNRKELEKALSKLTEREKQILGLK